MDLAQLSVPQIIDIILLIVIFATAVRSFINGFFAAVVDLIGNIVGLIHGAGVPIMCCAAFPVTVTRSSGSHGMMFGICCSIAIFWSGDCCWSISKRSAIPRSTVWPT